MINCIYTLPFFGKIICPPPILWAPLPPRYIFGTFPKFNNNILKNDKLCIFLWFYLHGMFWHFPLVSQIHLICFDSYIGITRKYVKRQIFIKSSMGLDAHGAVWLNTQDNCRRTLGSSARLGTSSDHKLRICQERRHSGRTRQEKGDTRAYGPRVSLFLTRPPLVSPFSWQILR